MHVFDGKFRKPIDKAVKPIGDSLRRTRLTPDHLTIVGLVVGVGAAVAIGAGDLQLGLLLVVLAALPDLFDGALAKASTRRVSAARSSTRSSTASPTPFCSGASRGMWPGTSRRISRCCRSRFWLSRR